MPPTMGSSDAVDPATDCRRLQTMAQPERMRLVFLGFDDESAANSVRDVLKSGIAKKDVVVWDWALLRTEPGGNVKITTDKSVDPGAARGAALRGAAGRWSIWADDRRPTTRCRPLRCLRRRPPGIHLRGPAPPGRHRSRAHVRASARRVPPSRGGLTLPFQRAVSSVGAGFKKRHRA